MTGSLLNNTCDIFEFLSELSEQNEKNIFIFWIKSLLMQVPDIERYCRISMNKGLPDRDACTIFISYWLQTEDFRR